MVVLLLSRTPPRLAGLLTRWLVEIHGGVYVGNVSASIRRSIWERVLSDVGKGRALMVFPSRTEQGLEFIAHNHDWEVADFDGLQLVRKPTEDEALRRHALELFSDMTASDINKAMAAWLWKRHPKARAPRARTVPMSLQSKRSRARDGGGYHEGQSMQERPDR